MKLTFLGTSDAFGAGGRRQAALLVESRGGALLLDCAPTTCTALASLGIARDAVDAIAVSHFHADHFAGIPAFLLAAIYEDARRHPLVVAGPRGVRDRVHAAADAIGYPLAARPMPFALHFVELAAGAETVLAGAGVTPFETLHDPRSCPHGLAVAADGRRLVYSGDTGWFDGLAAHARGADCFVCECTFYEHRLPDHLSYDRLHGERARLGCERLVLTHLGADMAERRGRLELETADDGLVLQV